jgi:hypothetical protein
MYCLGLLTHVQGHPSGAERHVRAYVCHPQPPHETLQAFAVHTDQMPPIGQQVVTGGTTSVIGGQKIIKNFAYYWFGRLYYCIECYSRNRSSFLKNKNFRYKNRLSNLAHHQKLEKAKVERCFECHHHRPVVRAPIGSCYTHSTGRH